MNNNSVNILLQVFAIIAPFIAAYLTYLFAIKSKIKDIDIEKEKHLNIALSCLLLIWNDLTRLRTLIYIIKDKSDDLIFSKKFLSMIILNEDLLNDESFRELKNSIEGIRKYDALTYFRLEDVGEHLNKVKTKFILPFLEFENIDEHLIDIGAGIIIEDSIKDYESHIKEVASLIGKKITNQISSMIHNSNKNDEKSVINEMNINYYQFILSIIPEGEEKPSYDEFLKISKTEEYQKMFDLQIDIFKNNGMSNLLSILSEFPDISIDEAIKMYNNRI